MAKRKPEFCPVCNAETMHVFRKRCFQTGGRDNRWGVRVIPPRCIICNTHRGSLQRIEKQKTQHVSFR